MITHLVRRRRWRSHPVSTNCFWWVCRQFWRRGGYITARRIDVAYGPVVARGLAALALGCFLSSPAWLWLPGVLFILHAPLFCFHWGWMPKHRRRLYHFRPLKSDTQIPWITLGGYIQLGEDHEQR